MKFTKPLIITDNAYLASKINSIISTLQESQIQFSSTNREIQQKIKKELNKEVYLFNLKKDADISFITKNYDLVISVHCKQLFPSTLFDTVKCINLHPGYNPINRGWYPQVFAILNQRIVGATLHEIDAELDHGSIIDRIQVPIHSWDTSLTLYNRILEAELKIFESNISTVLENNYSTSRIENEGFTYFKKDYNGLCAINLEEITTMRGAIDKLRALTHGDYQNAWFIDTSTGKKIYVKIELTLQNEE